MDLDRAYKDYPTIIREAGLNGYGSRPTEQPDQLDGDDLQNKIAALQSENTDLKAKIAAAQRALE